MDKKLDDLESKLQEGYKKACEKSPEGDGGIKFKTLPAGVVRQAMPTLQFS